MGLRRRRRKIVSEQPHLESVSASNGIASFSTDFEAPIDKIVIPISPKQDLHGYDHPWPAGGSRNLFDEEYTNGVYLNINTGALISNKLLKTSGFIGVLSGVRYIYSGTKVTVDGHASFFCAFYNENQQFISGAYASNPTADIQVISYPDAGRRIIAFTPPENTKYFRFSDGTSLSEAMIEIAPTADTATDYIPHANICPIEGLAGTKINRRNRSAIFDSTGFINSDGSVSSNAGYKLCDFYDVRDFNAAYYHVTNRRGYYLIIHAYDADKRPLRRLLSQYLSVIGNEYRGALDIQGVSYLRMCFSSSNEDGWLATKNESVPVSWQSEAGTVYGGTVTLNADGSIDVVCSWFGGIPNFSKLAVRTYLDNGYVNAYNYFNSGALAGFPVPKSRESNYFMCDKTSDYNGRWESYTQNIALFVNTGTNPYIYFGVKESVLGSTTLSALRDYLTEQQLFICYEIKNSSQYLHYHFDSIAQLKTSLGENNVWIDQIDNFTLRYWKKD